MKIEQQLLTEVMSIAKLAGQAILTLYQTQAPLEITAKHDLSPVTKADILANEIISQHLMKLTPAIPILSEEDPDVTVAQKQRWELYWLVDPLDGTREYIARTGQFTVNIALIENNQPILGVIYVPLKDITYAGAKDIPAIKNEFGLIKPIKTRTWRANEEIILVTTRRELQEEVQKKLARYGPIKITYRSSSLKFCVVAEGKADIYLRNNPIQEWDTAAGQCILESAGGLVLDSKWEALRYNTKPHLLNSPFIALGDSKQLLPILKTMPMFKEI